jgi:ATP-binding cassette subfamily C protein PrsD
VELFSATVAQNIARFDDNIDVTAVIKAAQAAGVHELIMRLTQGYETQIGQGGCALSAGQRQRIALARALYGDPFLVVLDEPNSNLDPEGEAALTQALLGVRARGGIVVVVAHRRSALAGVDWILVMNDGRIQSYGKKDEILANMIRRAPNAASAVSAFPDVAALR